MYADKGSAGAVSHSLTKGVMLVEYLVMIYLILMISAYILGIKQK